LSVPRDRIREIREHLILDAIYAEWYDPEPNELYLEMLLALQGNRTEYVEPVSPFIPIDTVELEDVCTAKDGRLVNVLLVNHDTTLEGKALTKGQKVLLPTHPRSRGDWKLDGE
jgi:hypothetical protein